MKFFSTLSQILERYRIYRKTVNDLSKLSDRQLKDIGIHRGMIRSIAMDTYK